jgi:hypothetical protein
MKDINLSVFQNGVIQNKTLQDFLGNQQVLICSVTRAAEPLTYRYIDYLKTLETKHNIKVILLLSHGGLITLPRLELIFPGTIVYDTDKKFVKFLAEQYNKTKPVDWLSKLWTYQVLFDNNSIVSFSEQPTEEHVKNLLKSKNPGILEMVKTHWKNIDENKHFSRMQLTKEENRVEYGRTIFYYNLWPNVRLEQFLFDNTVVSNV